jgi:hypothetical protein
MRDETINTNQTHSFTPHNVFSANFKILQINLRLMQCLPNGFLHNGSVPRSENKSSARNLYYKQANKLRGLSPRANYTDRATAACRRSECQLLRIEGAMWSA